MDPDALCTCGHIFDEHDVDGPCCGGGAFPGTTCSCPLFEEAD